MGFVYLMRSGRHYKIGKTNAVGRRERELAIQFPEEVVQVHAIRTDDPGGIEEYWLKRFGDRSQGGEWFQLSANDVAAFKRRKFMLRALGCRFGKASGIRSCGRPTTSLRIRKNVDWRPLNILNRL